MDFSKQIEEAARAAIVDKVFPGCVIGIVSTSGERQILPFGHFTYESSSPMVRADTIYDVASITKSIPTGSIALRLIDLGVCRLSDKLADYLPEFHNSDRDNVLVKHLLTYTLDGYGLASIRAHDKNALLEALMTHDFDKRPGTVFKYSNISAALLGLLIENVTGKSLDQVASEYFFSPLHMKRSTFYPESFSLDEIVPTEIDDWRGLVHGIVHDESAYICKTEGKLMGHAGLFSTAPDILNFLEMLLNLGEYQGRKYFSKDIIEQMQTNQIPELGDFTGLGWELNQLRFMGAYCTEHTFGKTGFTGTLCICDIQKEVAYVILSNRIYPKRPADSNTINAFRRHIGDIILEPQH